MLNSPIDLGIITADIIIGGQNLTLRVNSDSRPIYYFTGVNLLSNALYKLEIFPQIIPISAGIQGVISVNTRSSISSDALVYDSNDFFATWSIGPAPPITLSLTVLPVESAFAVQMVTPGQQYPLYIDLIIGQNALGFPNIQIPGGSILRGELSNPSFQIITCQFTNITCSSTNPGGCESAIIPNCVFTSSGFQASVDFNLFSGTTFRVKLNILNAVDLSTTLLTMYHQSKANSIIFEISNSTLLSSTNQVNVTISSFKTLWGINYGTNVPCPVGVYQPNGVSDSNTPVVNNIWVEFFVSTRLSGNEFGLDLFMGNSSKYRAILEGSIYNNFEPAFNSLVICASNFFTTNNDFGITCRGIGNFNQNQIYGVGARIFAKPYVVNEGDTITNYPQIRVSVITSNKLVFISSNSSYAGYNFYRNFDMTPTQDKNLGSFVDPIGRRAFGRNWILTIKKASLAMSPFQVVTFSEQLQTVCLSNTGTLTQYYGSASENNCSLFYTYGFFNKLNATQLPNTIFFHISGSGFSGGTYDNTYMAFADFIRNTHVTHKFMIKPELMDSNGKSFGLNLAYQVLGELPSTGVSKDCSVSGTGGNFCYPVFDSSDNSFVNGQRTATNAGSTIYLINKHDSSNPVYTIITITCVIGTTATAAVSVSKNCAFQGSSRKIDTSAVGFPGFEMITSNPHIVSSSKSSLYPDSNVMDLVYCMYLIPIGSVGSDGSSILSMTVASNGTTIKLKLQAILNFFHIDVVTNYGDLSSQAYFINSACLEDTSNSSAFSKNDGNHIPILLRLQYQISNIGNSYSAAAFFFTTKSRSQNVPISSPSSGIFGYSSKGTKTSNLSPTDLNSNFYTIPSSTIAGSGIKVLTQGYSIAGTSGFLGANQFTWNYQPYILIQNGSKMMDIYVQLQTPSFVSTGDLCDSFFKIESAVLAFLSPNVVPGFYNVNQAFNIYYTQSFRLSGYYSSSNSLNLGFFDSNFKMSGSKFIWDSFLLFNFGGCAGSADLYPITTNYVIGVSTVLNINPITGTSTTCKVAYKINNGFPGSAFSISTIVSPYNPTMFIQAPIQGVNGNINLQNCAQLVTSFGLNSGYAFNSSLLQNQVWICPFTSSLDVSLDSPSNSFQVQLSQAVPWFWGRNLDPSPISILNQLITFGWSLNGRVPFATGQIYLQNSPSNAQTSSSCTSSPYSFIAISTNTQKISWSFTSLSADIVLPDIMILNSTLATPTQQSLIIEDNITNIPSLNIDPHSCYFSNSTISNLGCSVDAFPPFLIYKINGPSNAQISISKNSAIMINLIASYFGNILLQNITHKVNTYIFKGVNDVNSGRSQMQLASCGNVGTSVPFVSSRSTSMNISNIIFSYSNRIHGAFELDFQFGQNMSLWESPDPNAETLVQINLGSLWNSVLLSSNVKCKVYQIHGDGSYQLTSIFQSLSVASSVWTLKPKTTVENPPNLKFKCFGGLSPSTNTSNVSVSVYSQKGILQNWTVTPNSGSQTQTSLVTINSIQVKFFMSGFPSLWKFNVSFVNSLHGGQSMIYVIFPTVFLPKLTFEGLPICFISSNVVDCYFINDYHLGIIASVDLAAGLSLVFEISGIVAPLQYGTFNQIIVQLDNNTNYLDGIQAEGTFQAPLIKTLNQNVTSVIPILNYMVSSNTIRANNVHQFIINLNAGVVTKGNFLYFFFPEIYRYSILLVGNSFKNCSLKNPFSIDVNTPNFALNCSTIGSHFVKMALSTDSNNVASNFTYDLRIGTLDSPQTPISLFKYPIIFLSDSSETNILSISSSGYANSSFFSYVDNPQLMDLNFQTDAIVINKGYFGSFLNLSYPIGQISTGLKFVLSGNYSSVIKIWQTINGLNQVVSVPTGESSAIFQIAAISSFNLGTGILQWSKSNNDPRTNNLPFLPFRVNFTACQISPAVALTTIPSSNIVNSYSLPIYLDFSKCMPVNSLTIQINVTQNVAAYFRVSDSNKSLINNYDGLQQFIFFNVIVLKGAPVGGHGQLNFSITGVDSESFLAYPTLINFTIIENTTSSLNPLNIQINSSIGRVDIIFNCQQPATIYYMFGINIDVPNVDDIKNNTLENGIFETIVDKSTLEASKQGFTLQSTNNQISISSILDLKANFLYSVFAFCVNQFNDISNVFSSTWIQANYNPLVGHIIINLNTLPSPIDAQTILNAVCINIQAKESTLNDIFGNICSLGFSRMLQLQPNSSATNSSSFQYIIILHPDLFSTSNSELLNKLNLAKNMNLASLGINNVSVTMNGFTKIETFPLPLQAPIIDSSSQINMNLSTWNTTYFNFLIDSDGFLFLCVYYLNQTDPSQDQIIIGLNGNSTACLVEYIGYLVFANVSTLIQLKYFLASSEYKLSYFFSSKNFGSIDTKYSSIKIIRFTTKSQSEGILFQRLSVILVIFVLIILIIA